MDVAHTVDDRPFVLHTRVVTGTGGGPEKTILNSPRFLRDYGIDSACLFMRPPGDPGFAELEVRGRAAGAEVLPVDDRSAFDFNVVRQAIRICRERRVTVWHGHDYKSNALGLLVRCFHRMQLVSTAHGWVHFTARTPFYYRIDRLCLKRYQQVLCVSEDLIERCRASGIPADRLTLVENAIVDSDYLTTPPEPNERARLGFAPETVLLGAVGRLSEEKGFDRLLRSTNRLVQEGHNVGLVIAGDGPLRATLQQQIDRQELGHRVRLCGFLPDPRTLYRAIDVFVLSSLREGLPNVVLEAMASQRAVVATRVNGIPRLVRDGENGIVVPVDDEEALTAAVRRMVTSPRLREQLAAAGRRTIEKGFSFARRMEHVVGIYRSLSPALAARIQRPADQLQTVN